MKILLAACNAKYIHSNLAVYNLKSCSGEYSSRVVVKEYTINQIRDDILKDIYLEQPDVVCFSCYIWNISFVRELVPDLKKILPQVEFWAGGPEVSYDAVEFLKKNPAFFGVMALKFRWQNLIPLTAPVGILIHRNNSHLHRYWRLQ